MCIGAMLKHTSVCATMRIGTYSNMSIFAREVLDVMVHDCGEHIILTVLTGLNIHEVLFLYNIYDPS